MELEKLYRVKHTILLQVVKEILIDNGLTTLENFSEKFAAKVDGANFSEEEKEEIKANI